MEYNSYHEYIVQLMQEIKDLKDEIVKNLTFVNPKKSHPFHMKNHCTIVQYLQILKQPYFCSGYIKEQETSNKKVLK